MNISMDNYTFYVPENGEPVFLSQGENYTTLGLLISTVLLSAGAFISQIFTSCSKVAGCPRTQTNQKKTNPESP